mmetsp:Transcript_49832/g.161159  ORF Transcript_49832/g.161159 Transcript_49832/m.161159 type:complete len:354 (+) Transcript_49832:4318-5379(+)
MVLRQCLVKLTLAFCLDLVRGSRSLACFLLIDLASLSLLFGNGLLLVDLDDELGCLLLALLDDRLHACQIDLQLVDDVASLVKTLGTDLVPAELHRQVSLLEAEQISEEPDQLQIRGRRHVRPPPQLLEELIGRAPRRAVDDGRNLRELAQNELQLQLLRRLFVVPLGHRNEGLIGPWIEPIDGGAINDGGELPATSAKAFADGRESQHDVQVLSNQLHEMLPNDSSGFHLSGGLRERSRVADDLLDLVGGKQVRNLSSVQNVVDVLQKALLHDLGVGEEEHQALALVLHDAHHHFLDVLSEVVRTVVARDLNGAAIEVRHVCRQPRHALPTHSADSHEQGVATGLPNDPGNP